MQVFQRQTAVAEAQVPAREAPELRLLRAIDRERRVRALLWYGARVLGALALLSVGAVHLQQYLYLYSAIPTIGTLFLLNFAGATAIGLALLTPVERLLGRWSDAVVALLALGGIGHSPTAFVLLLVSERTPLFGFMEPGYDPTGILASRLAEGAAIVLLGGHLAARFAGASVARW